MPSRPHDTFLSLNPLEEHLSPHFARQGANQSDETRQESYQLATRPKGDSNRSTGDMMLGSNAETQCPSPSPARPRRLPAEHPIQWTTSGALRPVFLPAPIRSKSPPIVSEQTPREFHCDRPRAPLKSSMKSVLKSAAETPAEPATGPNNVAEHPRVSQTLRRVKTVDFTEAEATRIRTLPLSKSWLSDTVLNACDEDESQGSVPAKSRCAVRGEPSFSRPGPKGRLVVPAVTKTEVHVITLAPTCELEVLPHELDIATANPTTQNVQPPDNSYAVVREDIPAEGKQEFPSQDSVTFLALRTPSPVTKCDLEGVNSKVSEWDWGQDLDSESSAPQIIIFPDDEGHAHAVTSMTDVEGDAAKRVPPNSQKTSSALSCPPSTPAIARPSRPPSHDKPGSVGKLKANSRKNSDEDTVLDVPISKAKLTISTTSSNKSKKPLADRRLSNVDDFEVKFRGHRDSVTMARSRLLAHRRVSPEVLEFSTTAKKRMHANNRGISEEEIANTNIASRELFRSHEFATLASSSPTARLGSSSPILSHKSGVLWGFKRSSGQSQINSPE